MKVFTGYSEGSAHLLRVWVRSWKKHGWSPRLIFQDSVKPGRSLQVTPYVINFGCRPGYKDRHVVHFGKRGWKTASLVRFPFDATEDTILDCGRNI